MSRQFFRRPVLIESKEGHLDVSNEEKVDGQVFITSFPRYNSEDDGLSDFSNSDDDDDGWGLTPEDEDEDEDQEQEMTLDSEDELQFLLEL